MSHRYIFLVWALGALIISPCASVGQLAAQAPSEPKLWLNYDFVPGNRGIFRTAIVIIHLGG